MQERNAQQSFQVALSIALYSTCSISMILLNKLVIYTYKLDYPIGLLFVQNLAAVALVVGAKRLGFCHYPPFETRVARMWLPLTVLFVLMLWTSMKSLEVMSVAVQTIIKNCAIILTAFGDSFFFGKKLNTAMFGAFVLMIIGSVLGAIGDHKVTALGIFWTLFNVVATCSYVLYMKLLLGEVSKEIGRYGPVFYNNLLSLPFMFVLGFVDLPDLAKDIAASGFAAQFSLFLMVLVGSVMTFATFWCMKMTSPTTYSVCGALNKIPLTVLSVFIFHHYPTQLGWLGIAVALAGGTLYTYLNLPAAPAKDPAKMEEGRRPV